MKLPILLVCHCVGFGRSETINWLSKDRKLHRDYTFPSSSICVSLVASLPHEKRSWLRFSVHGTKIQTIICVYNTLIVKSPECKLWVQVVTIAIRSRLCFYVNIYKFVYTVSLLPVHSRTFCSEQYVSFNDAAYAHGVQIQCKHACYCKLFWLLIIINVEELITNCFYTHTYWVK